MRELFLFVAYREWAINTHTNLWLKMPLVTTSKELNDFIKNSISVKYIIFVGWSEIIPDDIINNFQCFCIHPSKLPSYRGGSPIQNQICRGETNSAVTLFLMNSKIDAGPIFDSSFLSLNGTLEQIFDRISTISATLINRLLDSINKEEPLSFRIQDESMASYYKRRTPEQSEISIKDISSLTALELHNKIRCLEDPYPNAFILCSDGKKLFIKKSSLV